MNTPEPEHLDVAIVGAGLSGIAAAYYLQRRLPRKRYAILESRAAIGGTWDLFRYPGIRSDSDLHTYGYAFKPWIDRRAIAGGDAIMRYLYEAVEENGIAPQIRFHHRIVSASWDSRRSLWTLEVLRTDTEERFARTCDWLLCASGYFNYERGYDAQLPGIERFQGRVVHPQFWPADLDYFGARVVVIGSGATAMTIVPAMAGVAGHVTMLQRSPTYVLSLPGEDAIANLLGRLLPAERAYAITRAKNVFLQRAIYVLCQRRPQLMRRLLRAGLKAHLPDGYDVDTHFNPAYGPWDQRLCIVPDADLFRALSAGTASVVTGTIDSFTEHGVRLESGEELPADIVVTATGIEMLPLGGIEFVVDGERVSIPDTFTYKSAMIAGLPNFAFTFGYTSASWTLKVELVWDWVCRVIALMDERGQTAAVPVVDDPSMASRPFLDLAAGYIQRSMPEWPKQGTGPWTMQKNYFADVRVLREQPIDDGVLRFSSAVREPEPQAV